jgi:hypothetical protein
MLCTAIKDGEKCHLFKSFCLFNLIILCCLGEIELPWAPLYLAS